MGARLPIVVGFVIISSFFAAAQQATAPPSSSVQCIDCHTKITPHDVAEWKQSKHSQQNVGCTACHGSEHTSADDVANVKVPTPQTCFQCHQTQVEQYNQSKHGLAMSAMRTLPTVHWQPMLVIGDYQGCVSCHKIGSPKPAAELKRGDFGDGQPFGRGSGACDSCHSRHTFSTEEAKQPQACQKCHSGEDHAQWEMYSSSQHGIRYDLKRSGSLPGEAAAPTCQTCHMANGDHGSRTSWGYFGLSLPLPDDAQWAADRSDILKALAAFGPNGEESTIMSTMKGNESLRYAAGDWQRERDKMIKACGQCHSEEYARKQLQVGDDMVRNADHLLAEAIRAVAGLYRDGVLPKPWGRIDFPFPWLISFRAPTSMIEEQLQTMYLEHRTRAFHGAFHNSPNYAVGKGFGLMKRDLVEIQEMAAELRRNHKSPKEAKQLPKETKPKTK